MRLCLLLIFLTSAHAVADEPISTGWFSNAAAGGHDATVYHRLPNHGEAIKGEADFTVQWKGAEWRFATQEDRDAFAADPERYAPAYNGFCANALSLGEGLIPTSGKHWAIFDEQLYLFYAPRGVKRWKQGNYQVYKAEADAAWTVAVER